MHCLHVDMLSMFRAYRVCALCAYFSTPRPQATYTGCTTAGRLMLSLRRLRPALLPLALAVPLPLLLRLPLLLLWAAGALVGPTEQPGGPWMPPRPPHPL